MTHKWLTDDSQMTHKWLTEDSQMTQWLWDGSQLALAQMALKWFPDKKYSFKQIFIISCLLNIIFFIIGIKQSAGMCPHNLTKTQLEHHLNHHRNLALLGKILHETYGATKALARLPTTPITLPKINPPMQTFSVIPQSPTHYKVFILIQGLLYRWTEHSILPISSRGGLHKLTQSL